MRVHGFLSRMLFIMFDLHIFRRLHTRGSPGHFQMAGRRNHKMTHHDRASWWVTIFFSSHPRDPRFFHLIATKRKKAQKVFLSSLFEFVWLNFDQRTSSFYFFASLRCCVILFINSIFAARTPYSSNSYFSYSLCGFASNIFHPWQSDFIRFIRVLLLPNHSTTQLTGTTTHWFLRAPATQRHEFFCVLANAATTSLRFFVSRRLCVKFFIRENPRSPCSIFTKQLNESAK